MASQQPSSTVHELGSHLFIYLFEQLTHFTVFLFYFVAQKRNSGTGRPIVEVYKSHKHTHTHTHTHTQLVGLL